MRATFITLFFSLILNTTFAADLPENKTTPVVDPATAQAFDADSTDRWPTSLTYYNPLYFITGKPSTKVKFGFKYQPLRNFPLYLGYQQLLIWDLFKDSAPIRDTNYNPDVFYRLSFKPYNVLNSIDFGLFEHSSNGKDGAQSRSYDESYVRFNLGHRFPSFRLDSTFKAYATYILERNNEDLRDYLGYWSLMFRIHGFEQPLMKGVAFTARVFPGGRRSGIDFTKGAQEAGIEIKIPYLPLETRIYIQYYHGYVESLLNYNQSQSAFRAGLAL